MGDSDLLGRVAAAILRASIDDGATASPLLDEEARNLAGAVIGVEMFYRECAATPLMRTVMQDKERMRDLLHRIAVARRGDCPDVDEDWDELPDEIERMWKQIWEASRGD